MAKLKLPPSKAKVARLQPMVTAIHAAMRQRGLDVKTLTAAMGLDPGQYPAVYNWVAGKNGPSPQMRPKLAQALGLAEAVLASPTPQGRPAPTPGPAARALALVEAKLPAVVNGVTTEPVRDVFTITGRSDGQISLRLSVVLDATRGLALARFLMDAGLIISGEEAP